MLCLAIIKSVPVILSKDLMNYDENTLNGILFDFATSNYTIYIDIQSYIILCVKNIKKKHPRASDGYKKKKEKNSKKYSESQNQ